MYNLLLLHESLENSSKLKDYLQLGNCEVTEVELEEDTFICDLRQFHLILLDCGQLNLCLGAIENIRSRTQLPIVVLSDRDDEWEKIRLFQAGIDDFMVRPFGQGELAARIQAHIQRYKRLTRPFGIVRVGALEINAFSRRVFLEGNEVEMRLKEFEVLLYLAQRLDEAVTKEEIYEGVWKDRLADSFYNTVSVHVKKIREKIEKDISNPKYIETVWGVGYRLRSQ